MSALYDAAYAVVRAENGACQIDGNWCKHHESAVYLRVGSGDICNVMDDLLGLAEGVLAAVDPLIRADERERIAHAIEAAACSPYAPYRIAARIARTGGSDG